MQGFNMGRYRPPTSDPRTQSFNSHTGTHPLGKRASKLSSRGLLVVRFELPFNIWCNACSAHIAQGTRYNADKKKVGMYHSTPIWSFECKCRNCSGVFKVQTDPQNTRYVVTEGATQKQEEWERDEGEADNQHSMAGLRVEVAGAAERRGLKDAVRGIETQQGKAQDGSPLDAFSSLERSTTVSSKEAQRTQRILDLEALANSRSKDPYMLNSRLRGSFRTQKKLQEGKARQEKRLKLQMGWSEDRKLLLPADEGQDKAKQQQEKDQWRNARQELQKARLERMALVPPAASQSSSSTASRFESTPPSSTTTASARDAAIRTKSRRYGQPPPFLDGRPHFLDSSYQHVASFGKRPGAAGSQGRSAQDTSGPSSSRRQGDDDDDNDKDGNEEEEADADGPASASTDSEWEYEDLPPEVVIFDLGPDGSKLLQSKRHWASTGLETASPFLKVGNAVFKGSWQESIGTGIVLRDEVDRSLPWPHQHHPSPLPPPLPTTTHNRIKFKMAVNVGVNEAAAVRRSEQVQADIRASTLRQEQKRAKNDGSSISIQQGVAGEEEGVSQGEEEEEEHVEGEAKDSSYSLVPSSSSILPSAETQPASSKSKARGRPPLTFAQRTQRAIQRALQTDSRSTNDKGGNTRSTGANPNPRARATAHLGEVATRGSEASPGAGIRAADGSAAGGAGTARTFIDSETGTVKKKRGRPSKKDLEARAAVAAAAAAADSARATVEGDGGAGLAGEEERDGGEDGSEAE